MSDHRSDSLSCAALGLRAFGIRVLARQSIAPTEVEQASRASIDAWRLFLVSEACAVPLARRLRRDGILVRLDVAVRDVIGERELAEMQRILTVRWQLGEIDRRLARTPLELCVLKGGALVLDDDRCVDLGDIDLLVAPRDADRLMELLAGVSMHATGDLLSEHGAVFHAEGMLDVEVKMQLHYGPQRGLIAVESRPLAGTDHLARWTGWAAAFAMLVHVVEKHPHRCGHVRDLMVLAAAFGELSSTERALLMASIETARQRDAMLETVALAEAIERGEAPPDTRRLRTIATQKYLDLQTGLPPFFARFMNSRGGSRFLPAVTPWRLVLPTIREEFGRGDRLSDWSPPLLATDSAASHRVRLAVKLLWKTLRQGIGLVDGMLVRRRAGRLIDLADRARADARLPAMTNPA